MGFIREVHPGGIYPGVVSTEMAFQVLWPDENIRVKAKGREMRF